MGIVVSLEALVAAGVGVGVRVRVIGTVRVGVGLRVGLSVRETDLHLQAAEL